MEFIQKTQYWSAAALSRSQRQGEVLSRIHKDKIDEQVRQLFLEVGYKDSEEWCYVPTELASNYMLYLANAIATSNRLNLITNEWAPCEILTLWHLIAWKSM